jgi:hypothetical protein
LFFTYLHLVPAVAGVNRYGVLHAIGATGRRGTLRGQIEEIRGTDQFLQLPGIVRRERIGIHGHRGQAQARDAAAAFHFDFHGTSLVGIRV